MENSKISAVPKANDLKEMLYNNYISQKYVDISVAGSNGILKCHSVILYKNKVFRDKLKEVENCEDKVINVPQFLCETVRVILEYLYRDEAQYFLEIEVEVGRALDFFFPNMKKFEPKHPALLEETEKEVDRAVVFISANKETLEPELTKPNSLSSLEDCRSVIFQDEADEPTIIVVSSDDESIPDGYGNKRIKYEIREETEQSDDTDNDLMIIFSSCHTNNNKYEDDIQETMQNKNKLINPFSRRFARVLKEENKRSESPEEQRSAFLIQRHQKRRCY